MSQPVSPARVAQSLVEWWSPRVVAEVDDAYVEVAKVRGSLAWRSHDDEDELFHVLKGRLTIEMEAGSVELSEGQAFVVPKGVPQPGHRRRVPPDADRAEDDAAHRRRSHLEDAQRGRAVAAGPRPAASSTGAKGWS